MSSKEIHAPVHFKNHSSELKSLPQEFLSSEFTQIIPGQLTIPHHPVTAPSPVPSRPTQRQYWDPPSQRPYVVQHARLVIGVHQRDEARVRGQRRPQVRSLYPPSQTAPQTGHCKDTGSSDAVGT